MKLNLQKECLHYLAKDLPNESIQKLKAKIVWRQTMLRRFEMPYLEIFVTTHCNLKCKYCSNLIPNIHSKQHIDFDKIKKSVEMLLSKIDYLYRVKIHGGEVLLHPQLCDIIDFFNGLSKIQSIRITTNGTIMPTDEILQRIANSKIVVQVSDYNLSNSKAIELIEKFKTFGVRYMYLKDQEWFDMGDCRCREANRNNECTIKRCTAFYNGKIYVCSRAAIMAQQGDIPDEGIDVCLNEKELRGKIKKLYLGEYKIACLHCDGDTHFSHKVQAGEQNL